MDKVTVILHRMPHLPDKTFEPESFMRACDRVATLSDLHGNCKVVEAPAESVFHVYGADYYAPRKVKKEWMRSSHIAAMSCTDIMLANCRLSPYQEPGCTLGMTLIGEVDYPEGT